MKGENGKRGDGGEKRGFQVRGVRSGNKNNGSRKREKRKRETIPTVTTSGPMTIEKEKQKQGDAPETGSGPKRVKLGNWEKSQLSRARSVTARGRREEQNAGGGGGRATTQKNIGHNVDDRGQ